MTSSDGVVIACSKDDASDEGDIRCAVQHSCPVMMGKRTRIPIDSSPFPPVDVQVICAMIGTPSSRVLKKSQNHSTINRLEEDCKLDLPPPALAPESVPRSQQRPFYPHRAIADDLWTTVQDL